MSISKDSPLDVKSIEFSKTHEIDTPSYVNQVADRHLSTFETDTKLRNSFDVNPDQTGMNKVNVGPHVTVLPLDVELEVESTLLNPYNIPPNAHLEQSHVDMSSKYPLLREYLRAKRKRSLSGLPAEGHLQKSSSDENSILIPMIQDNYGSFSSQESPNTILQRAQHPSSEFSCTSLFPHSLLSWYEPQAHPISLEERFLLRPVRFYENWPGKHTFWFSGKVVLGPHRFCFFLTIATYFIFFITFIITLSHFPNHENSTSLLKLPDIKRRYNAFSLQSRDLSDAPKNTSKLLAYEHTPIMSAFLSLSAYQTKTDNSTQLTVPHSLDFTDSTTFSSGNKIKPSMPEKDFLSPPPLFVFAPPLEGSWIALFTLTSLCSIYFLLKTGLSNPGLSCKTPHGHVPSPSLFPVVTKHDLNMRVTQSRDPKDLLSASSSLHPENTQLLSASLTKSYQKANHGDKKKKQPPVVQSSFPAISNLGEGTPTYSSITTLLLSFLRQGFSFYDAYTATCIAYSGSISASPADTVSAQSLDGSSGYCYSCERYMLPRSRHCRKCDACVLQHDHHCPWVGSCIGSGNYLYFLLFLLFSSLTIILSGVGLAFYLSSFAKNISIVRAEDVEGLKSLQAQTPPSITFTDVLLTLEMKKTAFGILLVTFFAGSLIFPLVWFHCDILGTGETTHERVRSRFTFRSRDNPYYRSVRSGKGNEISENYHEQPMSQDVSNRLRTCWTRLVEVYHNTVPHSYSSSILLRSSPTQTLQTFPVDMFTWVDACGVPIFPSSVTEAEISQHILLVPVDSIQMNLLKGDLAIKSPSQDAHPSETINLTTQSPSSTDVSTMIVKRKLREYLTLEQMQSQILPKEKKDRDKQSVAQSVLREFEENLELYIMLTPVFKSEDPNNMEKENQESSLLLNTYISQFPQTNTQGIINSHANEILTFLQQQLNLATADKS